MMKVVLFGGSFDPIHDGHLNMASLALAQREADEVWFIPNQVSPFKRQRTAFNDRLRMVELMIQNHRNFKAIDLEGRREGPSFTIDTIRTLQNEYPQIEFEFLIGDDQIPNLSKWKDFAEIKSRLQIIVYSRLMETHNFPSVNGDVMSVSSSDIRNGMSRQTSPEVLKYMMENGLYLDQMIKKRLSKFRYEHSLRVTTLALELAQVHHYNLDDVYLSAMWHDSFKEDPNLRDILEQTSPEVLDQPQAFFHAYAAAIALKNDYYVNNEAVIDAIWNHVDGGSSKTLAKILYIADKCEPGRKYDTKPLLELSFKDLDAGFSAVKQDQEKFIKGVEK